MKKNYLALILIFGFILPALGFSAVTIQANQTLHCIRPSPSFVQNRVSQNRAAGSSAVIAWFIILADPDQTRSRDLIGAVSNADGTMSTLSGNRTCEVGEVNIVCKSEGQPEILIPLTSNGAIRARVGQTEFPCSFTGQVEPVSQPR
jgi:hypothetical protein